MTDKKPEWEVQFNHQFLITGRGTFADYVHASASSLVAFISTQIQQAKQEGFAEALNMVEEEIRPMIDNLKKHDSEAGSLSWSTRGSIGALSDLQAIIHKMRGEI